MLSKPNLWYFSLWRIYGKEGKASDPDVQTWNNRGWRDDAKSQIFKGMAIYVSPLYAKRII